MKAIACFCVLGLTASLCLGQGIRMRGNPASAGTTLYYGYGCNGTGTNTCTVGAFDQEEPGYDYGIAITTGSDASGYTVKACGWYIGYVGSSASMQCAVYPSGTTTSPVANCVASSSTGLGSTSGVWIEDTNFSGCTLAASTTYYLIFASNDSALPSYDSVGTRYYAAETFGSFPSSVTWSSAAGTEDSQYIRVTAN